MADIRVERTDATDTRVIALIERHFALMRASSPEESCHVMAPDALFAADTDVFAARSEDGAVLGIGALNAISDDHGEIKSMHTTDAARGLGIGALVLNQLLEAAKARGLSRVSLETGSDDLFAPARRLYERNGFDYCPPFADYTEDLLSVFMTRTL